MTLATPSRNNGADAQVFLTSEKAVVRYDPAQVEMRAFRKAVEGAGYVLPLQLRTSEFKVSGMDCTECTQHVQHALTGVTGVEDAQVFLASEKAIVRYDPALVALPALRRAVEAAGHPLVTCETSAHHDPTATAPFPSSP